MIITGAPVEHLPFEQVDYWEELKEIMDYTKKHVTSTLHLCWGAQAALYHHFNIDKEVLDYKIFGIYDEKVELPDHVLLRGFDHSFKMPHSRYSTVSLNEVSRCEELDILTSSDHTGASIIATKDLKQIFISGHPEYTQETLAGEYFRDISKGKSIDVPKNYFSNDDVRNGVLMNWKAHAHLLFANWINYCVYQITPYEWVL
jgi:homoserine O-succinyltransferase